jgi:hypothetical protein
MSEVDKIVGLLSRDAVERRIAAAIVLGEIKAKGAAAALATALDSGIPLLQRHCLEALARVGAKKAVPKILPLLGARDEDVRRAAVAAMVSVGDAVLATVRARMSGATGDEKRAIDAVLASLGGEDAFHLLLDGLKASDTEAANAAAIAVRQRVKGADPKARRSYLAQTEKFLHEAAKRQASGAAIAAGVKILGYLEDERAVPTLLAFTKASGNAPIVRQEALIALRFLLGKKWGAAAPAGGGAERGASRTFDAVVAALVAAARDEDRALAQTALHTLAGLRLPSAAMKQLESLIAHPDLERARFVMEMLGRHEGAEPARVLVNVLATTPDKRRAEIAASCLVAHENRTAAGAPGSSPVRDDAALPLARALVEATDVDRAWLLRNVLRPTAKGVPSATRKQLLETAMERLAAGEGNWEPLLASARDADSNLVADALRALAHKLRKSHPDKAVAALRQLCRGEGCTEADRYALASAELARGSAHDTRPAARAGDESLRLFGAMLDRGVDVAAQLRKDRSLDLPHLYYVGFHFAEQGHPAGEELLRAVVEKGGRTKIAAMAKAKLGLVSQP